VVIVEGEGTVWGEFGSCMIANGKFNGRLCGSVCGIVVKRLSGSGCHWEWWLGGAWNWRVEF